VAHVYYKIINLLFIFFSAGIFISSYKENDETKMMENERDEVMSQSEIKAITEEVKNAKSMEEIYYIVKRCTGKEKN